MALMRQHRWIWRAFFCKAGTLESMFAMRTRIWLSVYHTTVCASRESINACTDCETARSPRNSELRELSKSDQFWWRIFSSNWIQLPRAELVASEYTIFVDLRFTGHKGTPLMVARLSFQKFNSFMHLGVRETREFQFEIELTTAKVSLVMSLVTFPTQFLSEKFFYCTHWRASEPEKGSPSTPKEIINPVSEIDKFRYPSQRWGILRC